MLATTKKMIGIAALIAAGLVAADDLAMGSAAAPTETAKRGDRHPALAGTPSARVALAMQVIEPSHGQDADASKGDRLSSADAGPCTEQTWPRIAPECLLSVNATARKTIRTITVERQTGPSSSDLVRTPAL